VKKVTGQTASGSGSALSSSLVAVHEQSLQLTAIVELLEERGIMTQGDVLKRMKEVRDGRKVS
jgi:hypothetical protein